MHTVLCIPVSEVVFFAFPTISICPYKEFKEFTCVYIMSGSFSWGGSYGGKVHNAHGGVLNKNK